jgi:serine/threonine protein phosphatase PrpC
MLAETATRRKVLDFAAVSHQGHSRQRNEDCCFVSPEKGLAVVADGVGGQGDGAWASRRAVELFVERMQMLDQSHDGEAVILAALQSIHSQMRAESPVVGGKPSGTTIAGLWSPQGSTGPVTIFNIGDSPVFHLSKGKLAKLSVDHSLYQLWLDGGGVGREPAKRMIVQALGVSEQLTPCIMSLRPRVADSVLICTDGLSGAVSGERMASVLANAINAQNGCDLLLADALAGPARDNVTVSVCRF